MTGDQLRVEVLGSLRAWLGDHELDLGPARQRAVFAALATRAVTQPMSRADLIQAVWGDSAPASVNGSVHTYISGLRRILEPGRTRRSTGGLLLSEGYGYRLRLDNGALDMHVFNRLQDTARAHWHDGDAARAVETLDRALALWSGEALNGVPGPAAESLRANLTEHRMMALEMRAVGLLKLGGHEDLVSELAVLVREHPLRETLWQALMIALHHSGRTREALEVFQNVREVLRSELDIAPGPALVAVHQQILTNDPAVAPPLAEKTAGKLLSVLPGQVVNAIDDLRTGARISWGREAEIAKLRHLVDDVLSGRGRAALINGVPGIGKSELLATTLADAGERGCHVAWAAASELEQSFPLQVLLDCLGLDVGTSPACGSAEGSDPVVVVADRVLAYIDRLCATAPLILVIDDFQWADKASVLLWNRLSAATRQIPLLLVAASRPAPGREDLTQLRCTAESRGIEVVALGPLALSDAEDLIAELVGARLGDELRALVDKAGGNPLWLREMTATLVREQSLEIVDGIAKVRDGTVVRLPESLFGAVARTLDHISEIAKEALLRAAVLGMEFGLAQVAATMGRMPSELVGAFAEVMETRIIVDTGTELAFRHSVFRWAQYNQIPVDVRAEWHQRAAQVMAETGSGVEHIAQQLVAVPAAADDWVIGWLVDNHELLANRAPLIATVLLRRGLDGCHAGDVRREVLLAAYVRVQHRLYQHPLVLAEEAMLSRDPDLAAEMRHIAASISHSLGETEAAIALLEDDDSPETSSLWRERHRCLLANFGRGELNDLGQAAQNALKIYRDALAMGEPYPIGYARQTMWLISSIERDHDAALRHVDSAITVLEGHREHVGFYFDLLDNRIFSLQNLDRLEEAQSTFRTAGRMAAKYSMPHGLQVSSAVQDYWTGNWDDALVELDTVTEDGPAIVFHGLREPGAAALLLHGVAGLICGRRGDMDAAAAYLRAAGEHFPVTTAERENCDFLLVARSLQAEQQGDGAKAIDLLAPFLDPGYAGMMLRHQWLPRLIRLGQVHGQDRVVTEALTVCKEEAAKEVVPARAAAAVQWCEALVSGNPEPLLQAIAHYDKVGRGMEMASALSDVAILLAESGRRDEAQSAADDAATELGKLGAVWDLRCLENRMLEFDITPSEIVVATSTGGWYSLSTVEREIAGMVAQGRSNPEIATTLALSRRTVQAHVIRVLAKLGLASRNELGGLLGFPLAGSAAIPLADARRVKPSDHWEESARQV
jgi:DNA-binding SARP family transcriptional activator/ATP/maltotriose-dependent transcriptional regulator MalT